MTRGRALSAWRSNRSNPWSIASWDRRDDVILATKFEQVGRRKAVVADSGKLSLRIDGAPLDLLVDVPLR
jgi:hypothetical protein